NPTQFGPGEDFEKYPRPLDADLKICREAGVDVVFAPTQEQMYSSENLTWVNVEKLTESLCGQFRPTHFRGVTTVCAKLFNIVAPDFAFFGQKDAQQAIVIKRMAADLNMPLEIVVCPTVRESDGLAVSSRNKYLTAEQKKDATLIYKSLQQCREMIDAGTTNSETIITEMRKILGQAPSIEIEYISIVGAETLQNLDKIGGRVLAAVAVQIGPARLIDNILVDSSKK
ncbi:MAG: pantoate--beta-alanine ligase, partial [Planctomycetota bacterium]